MKILIEAAPGGYSITFEFDNGERKTYPKTISDLSEALCHVQLMRDEVEKETGIYPDSFVSAAAIRENRNRDITARKLWNDPNYRVVH